MGTFSSVAALSFILSAPLPAPEQPETWHALERPLAGVIIEGNINVPDDAMLSVIRCRSGLRTSESQIEHDSKALIGTRNFFVVKPAIRPTDGGPVLVFKVAERPKN